MIDSIMIAPPNSLIAIAEAPTGTGPTTMGRSSIASTRSCIVVSCLMFQGGETRITLGQPLTTDDRPAFDGFLDTPRRRVAAWTVEWENLLRSVAWVGAQRRPRAALATIPALRAGLRHWQNSRHACSQTRFGKARGWPTNGREASRGLRRSPKGWDLRIGGRPSVDGDEFVAGRSYRRIGAGPRVTATAGHIRYLSGLLIPLPTID